MLKNLKILLLIFSIQFYTIYSDDNMPNYSCENVIFLKSITCYF